MTQSLLGPSLQMQLVGPMSSAYNQSLGGPIINYYIEEHCDRSFINYEHFHPDGKYYI